MPKFNELLSTPLDQIMVANAEWPDYQATHPGAINTTVGVLVDPVYSQPWQPRAVKEARERALHDAIAGGAFGYQNQTGYAAFTSNVAELVFGENQYLNNPQEILAYQTLGGTGALSLAKDVLAKLLAKPADTKPPLILDAGWPNHVAIFDEAFDITTYEHMTSSTGTYNHQAAIDAFSNAPDGAVFLLQACGYNDDGMDRTQEQWDEILDIAQVKLATVILDSAYLGLADGFEEDRYPIEESLKRGLLTLVSFSASKNMGLYNERVGALLVANSQEVLGKEQSSRLKQLVAREVRKSVSSTPLIAAKAAAVAIVQPDYHEELGAVRDTLKQNRRAFATIVGDHLPEIGNGKGLFAKLLPAGFTTEQQKVLREGGVYALPNSRLNIGGLHSDEVVRVGQVVLEALSMR